MVRDCEPATPGTDLEYVYEDCLTADWSFSSSSLGEAYLKYRETDSFPELFAYGMRTADTHVHNSAHFHCAMLSSA